MLQFLFINLVLERRSLRFRNLLITITVQGHSMWLCSQLTSFKQLKPWELEEWSFWLFLTHTTSIYVKICPPWLWKFLRTLTCCKRTEFCWIGMRLDTFYKFSPNQWRTGQLCFSKSYKETTTTDLDLATLRICLFLLRWNRRREEILVIDFAYLLHHQNYILNKELILLWSHQC